MPRSFAMKVKNLQIIGHLNNLKAETQRPVFKFGTNEPNEVVNRSGSLILENVK